LTPPPPGPDRTFELAPGYRISRILKGGWQLAGGHGVVDCDAALEDMRRYAEAGITTFDCADIYTGVEELIGAFLARRGPADPEIQVHTKLVPDLDALASLTRDDVRRAVNRSCARLGTPGLDLVQLAWWDYSVPRHAEVATYLAEMQAEGLVRLLGATNFDCPRLEEITRAGVRLVSHQVQFSVVDRRPRNGMVELCRRLGIHLIAYGTLLGGFLSERYLGALEPGEPFENRSLRKYKLIIDEFGGWGLFQELLRALDVVARKHGVTIAAVGARSVLDEEQVGGVILGARSGRHLDHTLAVFDLRLDDEDRSRIAGVTARAAGPAGDTFALERETGSPHAAIMRTNLNAEAGKRLRTAGGSSR
jgi:aryl-alcohol dehydrogenase-like predicted oxidoreductase